MALQPRFEINDATAAIAAAESGDGITVALSYMVAKQIQEGRLVPVLASITPPPIPVHLVYRESRIVAPKVRSFVDYASPKFRIALQELKPGARRSTNVDLKRRSVINNRWIASRCGWTPYEGVAVLGWPVGTIIRGKRVMWEGELVTPGRGEPVRFVQAL